MTRPDVFAQLTPEQIAAYLTAHGWRLVEVQPHGDDVRVWECTSHQVPHEAQFPLSNHWSDYGQSLRWDLLTVANCEQRPSPAEQVARAIAEGGRQ